MAIPTYTQRGGKAWSPGEGSLLHSANPDTHSTHGKYVDESNLSLAVKTTP